MKTVQIKVHPPYQVWIEEGLLLRIGSRLLQVLGQPCAAAVVADETVDALYGAQVQSSLKGSGFHVLCHTFPPGEQQKTLQTWQSMLAFLAENRLTRGDAVLALGGGVTGDMAGFAAACYLRGLRLVQVPTTLLAMVDSSVGGKTAVNLLQGKNLIGAFHQPSGVLCDPLILETLPEEVWRDGVAEAVKMGIIEGEALFGLLEEGLQPKHLSEVIARCVAGKARLVEADERDQGERQLLNLGHSFGHAIEHASGYHISHGRGVAIGMVCAARLATRLGLCKRGFLERMIAALAMNGLPLSAPFSAETLCPALLGDKKRAGDICTLVLPKDVGNCMLYSVEVEKLPRLLSMALEE